MISMGLNKKLDILMYKDFCDLSAAGVNFGATIKRDHPLISLENAESYINDFYAQNKLVLEQNRDELTAALKEKQGDFFIALKLLFKMDFSSKDYRGYISIFDCNPRFIETDEFQVFYKRGLTDKVLVVFHEILHFAFFEYCDMHFAEEISDLDKNLGKLWELSEIFNVIILNTPTFLNITKRKEEMGYTELIQKQEILMDIWNNVNGDLDKFIRQSL